MEERRTSDIIVSINEELVKLHKEIIELKHDNELLSTDSDNKIRALMKDMLSVLDAFDRVRTVIVEKELDKGEDAKKVIQRFQNTEKILRNNLAQNGVREIALEVGTMVNDNICVTTDSEPDSAKENGTILSVEKKGFYYNESVLRPAEVIIVKN